jgi:AraC-like DNA-binding protein
LFAARFHMGARTLHRRLVDEGTTFRDVLTHVRRDLAERHLRERRLAIGEIGFLLGFSEPSAFHRAFKRWTGRPPHAYVKRRLTMPRFQNLGNENVLSAASQPSRAST